MSEGKSGQPGGLRLLLEEPFYQPVGNELGVFMAAWSKRLPVMLKGPTGCGKTRFLEHMAWRLKRPLVTVACHEDLTSSDLVGRYLIEGDETVWQDGPLTKAVREGAICYLDEVVEARTDTTVVIHPLTDHRRHLPIEKLGIELTAHPDFMLVISYNPGYQTVLKDLKPSTKQRFVGLNFGYPPAELETRIIVRETGLDEARAQALVAAAGKARNLKDQGLQEVTSTRALVYAGNLMGSGLNALESCEVAIVNPQTDDPELAEALMEIFRAFFPEKG
ncbi:CbbQ/NirQ/NorQ/GpvN family protein [Acidithiobacillus sulfuriphilus]|jgi:nitric oxide reductase NorQ protein|uniref:CbbQ/NirQ/NorQ/GpvN family protein n=2 Tax=Acidithiobacillus sulfuriphilus TaxID=1867749 RepID=A0A3M8RJX3_9PROT|nr:CbbQ/NirQ/NorQ/GpvN family protein [Acidithiobacillus sulfuriphilus]MCL5979286.1 CbbQ/NirQ/NorQ/GpvN family protein [Gammaproteobacteria bacterium]RNF68352.1 CbbQ/NirQ/NorQ/GpvN family protein [Acidithiobacillus sulfuriphilus]